MDDGLIVPQWERTTWDNHTQTVFDADDRKFTAFDLSECFMGFYLVALDWAI